MTKKIKLLFFVYFWILFSGVIYRYVSSNEILNIVPDVIVFILFYNSKQKNKFKEIKPFIGQYIPLVISLFLFFTTIASFVNMLGLLPFIWGLRMFLRYLMLFWLVIQNFGEREIVIAKKWLYRAYFINMFFITYQFFVEKLFGDAVGGIFTGNGGVATFVFITSFLFTGDYFQKRLATSKYFALMASMIYIAIVCEIKMLYFAIPLCYYAGYVIFKKFSVAHIIVLVIAYFAAIPAMTSVMSLYYDDEYVNKVFDVEFIEEETSHAYGFAEGIGFNRNTCVDMCNEVILQDDLHKAIGYGLGSGSASDKFGTWIFRTYKRTTYQYFTSSYVMVEGGWIGFLLYLSIFLLLMYRFWRVYKSSKDLQIIYWAGMGLLLSGIIYLNIWYNAYPYTDGYIYYFMWAICFVAIRKSPNKKELEYKHII